MYADFAFYQNEYHGTASEAEFARLSVHASAHIDTITHGRAQTAEGRDLIAVKCAECSVVDELIKQESGGIITAESNDGISRSYATGSVVKTPSQRIYAAAMIFLKPTDLLYAGV